MRDKFYPCHIPFKMLISLKFLLPHSCSAYYGWLVTEVTVVCINLNYQCVTPQRLWEEENKGPK